MPPVPEEAGSRRERVALSFGQVPNDELSQVTRRILEQSHVHVSPSIRYKLEDLLWAESAPPETSKKARRELARALNLSELAQHQTDARTDLYQRLLRSLPANSPGQRNLFVAYQTALPPSADDPALLPEVWLHWDHKTVHERGPEALLRSRMDFLLLLPHGQRVVLEVDGSQHYIRDHGSTPDTAKYAEMVAADRDLKLRGYEVFRFGHDELKHLNAAQDLVRQFIPAIFRRFRVIS